MMTNRRASVLMPAAFLVAACGAETPEPETTPTDEPAPAVTQVSASPDANADAVWQHLQSQAYRDNWDLWPDRGELYTGQEPHGMLLTTYVNDIASRALAAGVQAMPAGAIIVKENYMPDSTFAAATVMYKSPGFDAENNDWWWLKRLADGTVEASGKGAGCINCHKGMQANDYIWTSQIQGVGQ